MEHYVGIDVSLELSSVCLVDAKGKIVKEAKVASDPDALVSFCENSGSRSRGSALRPARCPNGCTLV